PRSRGKERISDRGPLLRPVRRRGPPGARSATRLARSHEGVLDSEALNPRYPRSRVLRANMEEARFRRPAIPLFVFFLATFAVSWTLFIASMALRRPGGSAATAADLLGVALYFAGVFGPALVALALTAREGGRSGVRALLARIAPNQAGARWYVFAILYMLSIKLAAALLHRILYGAWPVFGTTP